MAECPYCGDSFTDNVEKFRHAMTEHRSAVLAHWVDTHDVQPRQRGQIRLQEAVA